MHKKKEKSVVAASEFYAAMRCYKLQIVMQDHKRRTEIITFAVTLLAVRS